MTTVIKRNDTLNEVLKHWNHNNPSCIGLGRLSRELNNDGIYIINKTWGRQDLALFNITTTASINGDILGSGSNTKQLSFEPSGIDYRSCDSSLIKAYVANWVETNKAELHIQIHYLNWLNNIEIKNLTLEETIKVLESYQYNQQEAELLFNNLTY